MRGNLPAVIVDGPVPFLSFDDHSFYRQWALEVGPGGGARLETVFERRRDVAGVNANLVNALLSDRYIGRGMEIIRDRLPAPPTLTCIVRRARKSRTPALDSLIAEIEAELTARAGSP